MASNAKNITIESSAEHIVKKAAHELGFDRFVSGSNKDKSSSSCGKRKKSK